MKLLKKYIAVLIMYLLLMGYFIVFYVKGIEDGIYTRMIFITIVFVIIISHFIRKDILAYLDKLKIIDTGTKYLAVITDIMERGVMVPTAVQVVYMYIKVRFFDKDHELRDEWVCTNGYDFDYRDKFNLWQTVIICENDDNIILLSHKAEELAVEDTSEGAIVSDREILMDMSISGVTKRPVPQKS